MTILPSNFRSLEIDWYTYGVKNSDIHSTFYYEDEEGIKRKLATSTSVRESKEVTVAFVGEEVNGFRRIVFSNGRYGFQDASGKIAPYSFNIASDFNELGLAMVGTLEGATWINTQFQKLTMRGTWTFMEDKFADIPSQVTGFVAGLSRAVYSRRSKRDTIFINESGRKVEFVDDTKKVPVEYEDAYNGGDGFTEEGYRITSKGVFFASGVFKSFEEIVNLPEVRVILGKMGEASLKQSREGEGKTLKMIPNKDNTAR